MGSTLVRGTILAIVLALLLNFFIYVGGNRIGVSFEVTQPFPQVVGLVPIILATIVSTVLAAVFLWILTRLSQRPSPIFLWVATILALLSLIPVYTATRDTGSLVMLGLMHIATALAVTFSLIIFFQRCDAC